MDDLAADRQAAGRPAPGSPWRPWRPHSRCHRQHVLGSNQGPLRARAVMLPPHGQRVLMKPAHTPPGLNIALLALALTLVLGAGCSDDNPTNPTPGFEADRSTPEKLLNWLEKAYNEKDTTH